MAQMVNWRRVGGMVASAQAFEMAVDQERLAARTPRRIERASPCRGIVAGHRRGNRSGGARQNPQSGLQGLTARAIQPRGYLLGSYRMATAPEPNSSRLTSSRSTYFESPANNVGPWP